MYISQSTMHGSANLCYNFETHFLHKNSTPFLYLIKTNFVNALRDTWKSLSKNTIASLFIDLIPHQEYKWEKQKWANSVSEQWSNMEMFLV